MEDFHYGLPSNFPRKMYNVPLDNTNFITHCPELMSDSDTTLKHLRYSVKVYRKWGMCPRFLPNLGPMSNCSLSNIIIHEASRPSRIVSESL